MACTLHDATYVFCLCFVGCCSMIEAKCTRLAPTTSLVIPSSNDSVNTTTCWYIACTEKWMDVTIKNVPPNALLEIDGKTGGVQSCVKFLTVVFTANGYVPNDVTVEFTPLSIREMAVPTERESDAEASTPPVVIAMIVGGVLMVCILLCFVGRCLVVNGGGGGGGSDDTVAGQSDTQDIGLVEVGENRRPPEAGEMALIASGY